jgi:hypothetical protein
MANHKLRRQIMPVKSVISFYQIIILSFLLLLNSIVTAIGVQWDHSIDLDENFRLMWIIRDQDITFEVRVRTLGYVGLGFTRDGTIYGADVAVGWIDHGHAYFQVYFSHLILFSLIQGYQARKSNHNYQGIS